MTNPLVAMREEAREFREALASAPAKAPPWDVLGARMLMRRLGWLLMREHTEPGRLALAVFVGVMIGSSPFYLLHTGLVLLAAFALRLNKLAVWIASNVSFPLVAPLLVFASVQTGHALLHGEWLPLTLAGARDLIRGRGALELGLDLWFDWLVGCVPVGAALGAVLAGLTWRVAVARAARRSRDPGEPGKEAGAVHGQNE
jgi:uncharacterized protein (DUF2062 family)